MHDEKLRYLVIEQGATFEQYFEVRDSITEAVYDLEEEGYISGVLQIRSATHSDGGVLLFELTTENGGISLEYIPNDGAGNQWSGYLFANYQSTGGLIPFEDAVWDFYINHQSGRRQIVARGPAMLIPKVSE